MMEREDSKIILARIDERVKNLVDNVNNANAKITAHMVSFEEHKIEDNRNFSKVNWWVAIGIGVVGTLQVVILAIKH